MDRSNFLKRTGHIHTSEKGEPSRCVGNFCNFLPIILQFVYVTRLQRPAAEVDEVAEVVNVAFCVCTPHVKRVTVYSNYMQLLAY